jgi:radical SAM family uncharacterized protein/radical SAM-linked protein
VKHPYQDLVHDIARPSRYLGGEFGQTVKEWRTAECRVCLAFPDLYEVGMSHLGLKILYAIINRHPALLAERAYAPWFDMEQRLRETNEPLRSLESGRPLGDFDVVGFSLGFELHVANLLQMLELGRIPLRSADRSEGDPLVLAGGAISLHPEPMADFLDALLVGDGEEQTVPLLLRWSDLGRRGLGRAPRLRALAELPGVYVPSLYGTEADARTGLRRVARADEGTPLPVRRLRVDAIEAHPFPVEGPVASTEAVFDRVSVEIARGCHEGCRFCQAGIIYRPLRERSPGQILDVVERSFREYGYETASLTSLSTADYSAIKPLVRGLSRLVESERMALIVSSLRGYGLDREVLRQLKLSRSTGLTLAPEAGSERLRDVINKNVSQEQLLESAERIFDTGWSRLKLYFMIGLPTETDRDVSGIIETASRVLAAGKRILGRRAEVTVSVSTHVPKPHTPFQWCAMNSWQEIERKQALLRREARGTRLRLKLHDPAGSWLEAALCRGDRTLSDVVERAYRRGARFESWKERLDLQHWHAAFEESGVSPDRFLRGIPLDSGLPWDHIDTGVERKFLVREHRRALSGRPTPPCGKPAVKGVGGKSEKLVCHDCGMGCDLERMAEQRRRYSIELCPDAAGSTPPRDEPQTGAGSSARARPRRPPERSRQGAARRLRLGFRKLGRSAFLSHLDLVRTLPRILRRAGLPLYYSEGFHPKAMMIFGPALGVGVCSLAEYVDVRLRRQPEVALDCDSLIKRLSDRSPDGISFFAACELGDGDAKLSRVIDQAVYVAALPLGPLRAAGLGDAGELEERLRKRLSEKLLVRRVVEEKKKTVDVGRYLLEVCPGEGEQVLKAAGLGEDSVALTLGLRIAAEGTAKPGEALQALLGEDLTNAARFVRSELLWTRGGVRATPLQLEALQSRPASSSRESDRTEKP